MPPTVTLLEPSLADLIAAVEQATELSEQRLRHWVCSLRQIAKWLDRPVEVIPARLNALKVLICPIASRPRWRHGQNIG